MACQYYYFCGLDHRCSINGTYGDRVTDSHYSRYCKNNYKKCEYFDKTNKKTNRNTNNPNNKNNESNCFITTIICNILGKDDNDILLNNLRWFRDNILQKDDKYNEILKNYDVIGPIIATHITNDKNRLEIAKGLHNNILLPINNLILKKEYDKACERYYIMTLSLINYYGLKHNYNQITDNNYYYKDNEFKRELSGHGKRKILAINTKK